MPIRDLFLLLFKLLGLYVFIQMIFFLLPMLSIFSSAHFRWNDLALFGIALFIGVGILYILIAKSASMIGWLKLEKGFEENRIDLKNASGKQIVKIACVLIGGIMVVNNLPDLLNYLYFAFRDSVDSRPFEWSRNSLASLYIIKIAIGVFLVKYYERITTFLKVA